MAMFDDLMDKILSNFSEWIQVQDPKSNWTLDNVLIIKDIGVDKEAVKPHCVKCVVANQCWFKNEKGKKPERFDYSTFSNNVLEKLKGIDGLYHPNCHCKEVAISKPTEENISIIVDDRKINDFYRRKSGLATAWGYSFFEKNDFKKAFIRSVLKEYINGEYSIFKYDGFGIQITIIASIPGINYKKGRNYKFQTGFMIYPNGKIENTTIFGGKIKWIYMTM